jgi:hypothetical protein
MTFQAPELTPYQAQLKQAHRMRQMRFAAAARRATAVAPQVHMVFRRPLWKTSSIFFDAHVKSYQLHLANKLVRPEVAYIKQRCAEIGMPYREVIGRSSLKSITEVRRLLMWEVREKFGLSFFDVGRAFGGRDQSTAISAIKSVQAQQKGKL